MLILPLIDLLILVGTVLLGVGFVMKAIALATIYRPSIMGFGSLDFVIMTGICWGFAVALAARTWVKLNEPRLLALRREQMQAEARRQAREVEIMARENERAAPAHQEAQAAGADRG